MPGADDLLLAFFMAAAAAEEGGEPEPEPEPTTDLDLVSATYTTSTSSSFAVPGVYAAGYLIVVLRTSENGSTVFIGVPSGYTPITTETSGGTSNGIAGLAVYKEAGSSSEVIDLSSGLGTRHTWIYVFKNPNATPIGDFDGNGGNSRTATLPALTLANSKSYVIGCVATRGDETPGAFSGMTNVSGGVGTRFRGAYVGPTGSFSSKTVNIETSTAPAPGDPLPQARYITMNVEIVSA